MSLATQFRKLTSKAAAFRQAMVGEEIVISDFDGPPHKFQANPAVGTTATQLVEGGYYEQSAISYELRTADLAGFVPRPEMPVTARGKGMRIAPDGVTPGLVNFRIRLIAARTP